ncbi:MAG TPA: helix-turn-helix domain-containing protein [Vicinamibacterales bacterium]|nr:helix-turn-helix domain-containing protein [Vicinamibacterales bacterium]
MAGHTHGEFACPIETTLEVLGGKWKGMVLHRLIFGTRRFNELRRLLPHVTQRMLTRQLRELERDGVIRRRVYAEVPPRVEYSLSEFGLSLKPILLMMGDWGAAYQDKVRKMKMSAPAPGTGGRLAAAASQQATANRT